MRMQCFCTVEALHRHRTKKTEVDLGPHDLYFLIARFDESLGRVLATLIGSYKTCHPDSAPRPNTAPADP